MMDHAARTLKVDPINFRHNNLYNSPPVVSSHKDIVGTDMSDCLAEACWKELYGI